MRVLFTIAAFPLLLTVFNADAQNLQGEIIYESKINMHRRLPPGQEEMKKMIPEFNISKEQLVFTANESLYKPIIEDEPEAFDGGGVSIQLAKPYFEHYLNGDTKQVTSKREFMGKSFLIEDELPIHPWKFTNETKAILGYECKQAYYTTEDTNQTITAWYTSALRPFLGPGTYGSLPGAILALDINNEDQVYVATKIELRELKKNEIKIPKGGEVTTEEGFKKMRDERIKQMGGHGGVVIRN